MLFGYARESATSQRLDDQIDRLKAAGCIEIFTEKEWNSRAELAKALHAARFGDVIVATSLDRMASDMRSLFELVNSAHKTGVGLRSLSEPWADPTTVEGRHFLTHLKGLAHFEVVTRADRLNTPRMVAYKTGVRFGAPPKLSPEQRQEIIALWASKPEMSQADIAQKYGVHDATISRIINPRPKRPKK